MKPPLSDSRAPSDGNSQLAARIPKTTKPPPPNSQRAAHVQSTVFPVARGGPAALAASLAGGGAYVVDQNGGFDNLGGEYYTPSFQYQNDGSSSFPGYGNSSQQIPRF